MSKRGITAGVLFFLTFLAPAHSWAQDAPGSTLDAIHTENALRIISKATRFIEATPAFMARGETAGELVLDNDQLIEHGTQFTVIFNRPSQMKLVMNSWDGSVSETIFDGETITVSSVFQDQYIYDTAPQPGDVDESLDFMMGQLDGRRELEFFLSTEFSQSLSRVQSGISLGESTIRGVLCDHVAFRVEGKDGQAWIARGEEPVPWRILISHRAEPLMPRFWIQFAEWDFAPEITEATFRYTPPEGAEKFQYFDD